MISHLQMRPVRMSIAAHVRSTQSYPVLPPTPTSSLHWPKATDLPEGTTQAVDFGAGGISGIGPLTARNLDGRSVRVNVVGEKDRGVAEFYSVHSVRKERRIFSRKSPNHQVSLVADVTTCRRHMESLHKVSSSLLRFPPPNH
jgi:hypothetical protein